ncbi:hypothetical protein BS17DRAFT_777441 [Gyrodon lividus]|nr:hypothetical protein BS17DRAFT_777441 [Gyrodon lividus]
MVTSTATFIQLQNILLDADHSQTVFLVDFGLSQPYHHLATGKHLPFHVKCGLNGMPAFTSINGHLGGKLGCHDNLESLVYVLAYLLCGSLPWIQDMEACQKKYKLSAVLAYKCTTALEQLCNQHYFPELSNMLLYIRMLSFEETPDYDFLRSLLQTAIAQPLDQAQSIQLIEDDLLQTHPSHPVFTPRSRCRAHIPPAQFSAASPIQKTGAKLAQIQRPQGGVEASLLDNPMVTTFV